MSEARQIIIAHLDALRELAEQAKGADTPKCVRIIDRFNDHAGRAERTDDASVFIAEIAVLLELLDAHEHARAV